MMRTGNPALRRDTFTRAPAAGSAAVMTIEGTVNKTMILLALLVAGASWVWKDPARVMPYFPFLVIGTLIFAIVTIFKKQWANVTGPAYAVLEGLLLGAISSVFEQQYPGIVVQAVMLTFGTLFALLIAYKSKLIPVTQNFKLGIVAATGGIALLYLVNLVMGFFGSSIPFISGGGTLGIGFSVVVVIIAALNLVLDFDFIEQGAACGAPKYMEWYGAFGLVVTLAWLYLEILRLLAKTQQRR